MLIRPVPLARLRALWPCAALLAALGCNPDGGMAYVLSEAEGVEVARAELSRLGYAPTGEGPVLTDLVVCQDEARTDCTPPVTLRPDGWDPVHKLGFEYFSTGDADLGGREALLVSHRRDQQAVIDLQAAANEALGDAGTLILLPEIGHQTQTLAREGLLIVLEQRLIALGIGAAP